MLVAHVDDDMIKDVQGGPKKGALAFSLPNHEFLAVSAHIFRQWSSI
jgi:hypothetical protein